MVTVFLFDFSNPFTLETLLLLMIRDTTSDALIIMKLSLSSYLLNTVFVERADP